MNARTLLFCSALLMPAAGAIAQTAGTPTAGSQATGSLPPLPAAAQPAATQPTAAQTASTTAAAAPSATLKAADQRIQTLKTQLGITPVQTPLWDAFAQAMRDNAASTDALFQRRATTVAAMNAVDNMRSYAEIARDYASNTERLATAFESLYASLSDTQKQAADALFRQQAVASAQPHK